MFTSTATSITKMSALVSGVGTDAAIYDDPQDADIPTLLDSRYDADKAQGLKRLIALMAQGQDVSNFFPQVVKGVASQSLEVKKLVYIYLVHYADKRPDEALLSINSFQRDLSDINPVVRAWALRAMSGIKVRAVIPLVIMAANKCARDPSPYVRRCAANAVSKIYSMGDEQHIDGLVELVSILLNDNCAGVVGAAAAAYSAVCPEEYSLLKPNFRKLCGLLSDSDPWGQVTLMDILMRYLAAIHGTARTFASTDFGNENVSFDDSETLPADTRLLLSSTLPLLQSQNTSAVLQAAAIYWFFSPRDDELVTMVKPLLFLLRSSYESQYVVLANVLSFSKCLPSLFESYYEDFYIRSSDSGAIRALKLDILTNIVADSSVNQILQELEAYIRSPDSQFSSDAVNAIGRCAMRLSSTAVVCTRGLLRLVTEKEQRYDAYEAVDGDQLSILRKSQRRGGVVVQAVLALRAIVQKHPGEHDQVMLHLLHNLNCITEPTAREVVIWMIGEHGLSNAAICQAVPVVLQYLAKTFVDEADGTRLQILNCLAKVILTSRWGSSLKKILLILQYVLNLASCDLSYDVRDRARMLRVLLGGHLRSTLEADPSFAKLLDSFASSDKQPPTFYSEVARSMLLSHKTVPVLPALSFDNFSFLPGSMSHIVQHMSPGYRPLPQERSIQGQSQSDSDGESDEVSDSGGESSGSIISTQAEDLCSDVQNNNAVDITGKINLISLSDHESFKQETNDNDIDNAKAYVDLEAWLGQESPATSSDSVSFSIPNWEPKKVLSLDFTNGGGLEVQYCFTRTPSSYSPNMVCLRLYFHNKSLDSISEIGIGDEVTAQHHQSGFECGSALVIPPQVIATIEPGEKSECDVHIDFRHSLSFIKMWLHYNAKKFPVKITPEAGALLRPRQMSLDAFHAAESKISGMHRSSRRVFWKSNSSECCKGIISTANVAVVSIQDMVLHFSAETLTGSLLCLISVSREPSTMHGTLKVSCEDTLFGLALLNQLDKSLASVEL